MPLPSSWALSRPVVPPIRLGVQRASPGLQPLSSSISSLDAEHPWVPTSENPPGLLDTLMPTLGWDGTFSRPRI